MKTPLRYQMTEFDCGTVSLLNCIMFLFEREEIPAELVKAISSYTLDCYDEFGNLGQKGTSKEAVKYLSHWIVEFSEKKDMGISCKYLKGKNVTLEQIKQCLDNGGCVNLRTYYDVEHYVTITKYDNEYIYVFDPYFSIKKEYEKNEFIDYIPNKPFNYNKRVKIERLLKETKDELALGPISKREAVLITRKRRNYAR